MSLNTYDYQEELSYISLSHKSYNVTISDNDKIISIDEDGSLMAAIALEFADNTLYLKGKNDNLLAEIELPNYILSIDELSYDSETKQVNFKASHVNGDDVTFSFDVQDLVDLYQAGDGITIEDNKISVKIAEDSNEYLSANENGISIDLKEITKGIDGNISEIDRIKEDAIAIKSQIENIESEIDSLELSLTDAVLNHGTDIDELKSIVGEQEENARVLTDRVAELEQTVGKQSEDSRVLTERVAQIENIVGEQEENAGVLTDRVASLEELIGDVQGAVSSGDNSILDRIDTLEQTVGERIDGVESSLVEMVNENTESINNLNSLMGERFESVEGMIDDLTNRHDSEISDINDKISANTESIATNASDIKDIDADLNDLKSSLNEVLTIEYPIVRVNESLFGATTSSEVGNSTVASNLESVINKIYVEMQKTADSHTEDINKFINETFLPVKDVVDKLDGEVSVDGSIKNIVSNEIAKIVDETPEAFDTLKEIAQYIEEDKVGAVSLASGIADNASEIENLKTSIADEVSNRESSITEVKSLITDHRVECQSEFDSLNAKDDALDSKIDGAVSEINNKFIETIASVDEKDNGLAALIEQNKTEIDGIKVSVAEDKEEIVAIKSAIVENKRISDESIAALNTALADEISAREASVTETLETAKSYSDDHKNELQTSLETSINNVNTEIARVSTVADDAKEMSNHLSNTIERVYFNGFSDTDASSVNLIQTLIDRITALEQELAHIKGVDTEVGSMSYLIKQSLESAQSFAVEKSTKALEDAKLYTNDSISTSENTTNARIEASISSAKTEVKEYTDSAKTEAINTSNAHADIAKLEAVAEAKSYSDAMKSGSIAEAKSYADEKVSDVNGNITTLRNYTDAKFGNYMTSLEITTAISSAVNDHDSSITAKFVDFSTDVDGKISTAINTEIIRSDGKYEPKGTCIKMDDVLALNYVSSDALAARNYQNANQVDAKIAVVNNKIDTNYYTKETVDSMHNNLNNTVINNKALADVTYATKSELSEHITEALSVYIKSSDANATYATIANLELTNGNVNSNTTKINAMKTDIEAMGIDIDIIKLQLNPLNG